MLTLYHWEPNANSGKPMLVLKEKGLAFESRYVDLLNFEQHSPEYLKLNPAGTIPTMIHDGLVLTESTAIAEYLDEVFPNPPLRPESPKERWRMRWWMKFFDQHLASSSSMIGWKNFIGPAVRERHAEKLEDAIDRIPLKERRIAWSKAIHDSFSEEELAESRRRVAFSINMLEEALSQRPWIAGASYSLADINGFNLAFGFPVSQPQLVNDERTPHIMAWLRAIYARPATQAAWAMGRTTLAERVKQLARPSAAA